MNRRHLRLVLLSESIIIKQPRLLVYEMRQEVEASEQEGKGDFDRLCSGRYFDLIVSIAMFTW